MADEKNETASLLEMMKQMMCSRPEEINRARRSDVSIKSVSIPIKVKTRREKMRVYVNCESKIEKQDDLLEVIDALYQRGFDPDWWADSAERNDDRGGYRKDYRR